MINVINLASSLFGPIAAYYDVINFMWGSNPAPDYGDNSFYPLTVFIDSDGFRYDFFFSLSLLIYMKIKIYFSLILKSIRELSLLMIVLLRWCCCCNRMAANIDWIHSTLFSFSNCWDQSSIYYHVNIEP